MKNDMQEIYDWIDILKEYQEAKEKGEKPFYKVKTKKLPFNLLIEGLELLVNARRSVNDSQTSDTNYDEARTRVLIKNIKGEINRDNLLKTFNKFLDEYETNEIVCFKIHPKVSYDCVSKYKTYNVYYGIPIVIGDNLRYDEVGVEILNEVKPRDNINLDEAIEHATSVAKKKWEDYKFAVENPSHPSLSMSVTQKEECLRCSNEHEQLALWLTELKERREKDNKNE